MGIVAYEVFRVSCDANVDMQGCQLSDFYDSTSKHEARSRALAAGWVEDGDGQWTCRACWECCGSGKAELA